MTARSDQDVQDEMARRKEAAEEVAIESVHAESDDSGRARVQRPRGSLAYTSRKNLGPDDWSRPFPEGAVLKTEEDAGASVGLLADQRSSAPSLHAKLSSSTSRPGLSLRQPSLRRAASSVLASPRMVIRSASSALTDLKEGTKDVMQALRPGVDLTPLGIDVLGLAPPPPPSAGSKGGATPPPPPPMESALSSHFDDEELFEVEAFGANGEELSPMIAGEGLTSAVLREGDGPDGSPNLGWAEELLLLTHEPLRRDMLEMQRAVEARYLGDLPESWRVRAFFRFFQCWCTLVSQQFAVEVAVHYDWLAEPTGKIESDTRREVLAYHRKVELEMHSISRLEGKILNELVAVADWNVSEPWSECAQELRQRLNALCSEVRMHLATQERLLPALLRMHWGSISPPQLVTRSLKAAKSAQSQGSKGADRPQLIMWVLHYLSRRDVQRARYLRAALPMTTRLRIVLRERKHKHFLAYLRYIVRDEQPASSVVSNLAPPRQQTAAEDGVDVRHSRGDRVGSTHEKQRRAGLLNAMLAAANAERVDVPTSRAGPTRSLAESQQPLHSYNEGGGWANRHNKVPSNFFKKIGMEQPATPRRL